jgi:hypothetical protein
MVSVVEVVSTCQACRSSSGHQPHSTAGSTCWLHHGAEDSQPQHHQGEQSAFSNIKHGCLLAFWMCTAVTIPAGLCRDPGCVAG